MKLIPFITCFCFSYRTGETRLKIESQDEIFPVTMRLLKIPENWILRNFLYCLFFTDLVMFSDHCNVICNVESQSMQQKARRAKVVIVTNWFM